MNTWTKRHSADNRRFIRHRLDLRRSAGAPRLWSDPRHQQPKTPRCAGDASHPGPRPFPRGHRCRP